MESNIFTLIGNRMKERRMNWSIKGANNLASILCAYHTTGMENLFVDMPRDPEEIEEWIEDIGTGEKIFRNSTRRIADSHESATLHDVGACAHRIRFDQRSPSAPVPHEANAAATCPKNRMLRSNGPP